MLDDLTDKNTEARGQGVANVATGFLGGMAGCAMIGQSMINFRSGGRTRLSTLASGVFLLVLILALGDLVAQIPMAALVAVMIMVAVGTFDWRSISPSAIEAHPIGVEIDLTDARIWDTSAVAALDTVVEKFSQRDIEAVLVGMNRHAERLHTSTSGNVTVH